MGEIEESLIAIPRINPINFNTYASQFLESYDVKNTALAFKINDANSTGLKGFLHVPFDCEITGYSLLADVAGNVVVDIWVDVFANFPPTIADTITAAAKPTLAAAQGVLSTVLTGWTVALTAGDVIAFNIDSTLTLTELLVTLFVEKTL